MKKLIFFVLLSTVLFSQTSIAAFSREYNDIDDIMNGIEISINPKLKLASPSKNVSTTASSYYITGTYNPQYPLICNGYTVSAVGKTGTFATYVSLNYGKNVYEFSQQDGSYAVVTITRNSAGNTTTTNTLKSMTPSYDSCYESGTEITLECIAPYSANVTATLLGQTYTLSPVAVAQVGIPATYKTSILLPSVSSISNAGKVTYTMTYNGAVKKYYSEGSITAYPTGSTIYLTPSYPSVPLVTNPNTYNSAVASLRTGGIDYVVDQTDSYYKLSSGYWIVKDSVKPVLNKRVNNTISNVSFAKTMYGEMLTFEGTSTPLVVGDQNGDTIKFTMYHTTGLTTLPISSSEVISDFSIKNSDNATNLSLKLASTSAVLGYVVEYDENTTTIYLQYRPKIDPASDTPLKNIRIVLDPGHGGTDPGALGVATGIGDNEAKINRNTAIALQRRLEKLGAQVYLVDTTRTDRKINYTERTDPAYDLKAHVFLSIHHNSTAGDARKANGVEVHYFYDTHKSFSEELLDAIVSSTGRAKKDTYNSVFRVSFNTLCPAPLLELGFISNPVEYDKINTRTGIFNTVNGIANGIIEYFS